MRSEVNSLVIFFLGFWNNPRNVSNVCNEALVTLSLKLQLIIWFLRCGWSSRLDALISHVSPLTHCPIDHRSWDSLLWSPFVFRAITIVESEGKDGKITFIQSAKCTTTTLCLNYSAFPAWSISLVRTRKDRLLTLSLLRSKSVFLQPFKKQLYEWCSENL